MSFDPNLVSPRDRIRHRLGDIYEPPLRPDVEYDALLVQYSELEALALMAESLASEYAQNPSNISVGGVTISYPALVGMVGNWQKIAAEARAALAQLSTGVSHFSSESVQRDGITTSREGEYRRSMHDLDGDGNTW